MSVYRISQWVLIFFIYSFLGWVWESLYKTIRQKKWVNRGYLNGPWLPIYGFGALMILFVTLPFKQHHMIIFVLGMVVASIFELVVGCGMEKLFHVRYWDYSKMPYNIRGYISLPVSILWGVFSLILVNIIDLPISRFVSTLPSIGIYLFDLVFGILFLLDVVFSTIQALNLKKILKHHPNMLSVDDQMLKKVEKVLKRNPTLFSKRHQLNKNEIKNILNELNTKDEKNDD